MKTIDLNGACAMEPLSGCDGRWYWSTDYIHGDLYEAEELFRSGHPIQCNAFYLVRYPDGQVFEPLEKLPGQYSGRPVFDWERGTVMIPVVDFRRDMIRILQFDETDGKAWEVVSLPLGVVPDCYNLMLHTSPLMLSRQPGSGKFSIVWPERVSFQVGETESLNFRLGDKLYFTAWYEDPDYREETVVRSVCDGSVLERFSGDVQVMPDGQLWVVR